MIKTLKHFFDDAHNRARIHMQERLETQCSEDERYKFRKIFCYHKKGMIYKKTYAIHMKLDLEKVIAAIPDKDLSNAMDLVERTIRKHQS